MTHNYIPLTTVTCRPQNQGSSNSVKFYRTQDTAEGRQKYRHGLKTKTWFL